MHLCPSSPCQVAYGLAGRNHYISVYPTVQFLYSHHIQPEYINDTVYQLLESLT